MPLSARKCSNTMMSVVMGLMGYSIEFQRHTAPTIAATWTYCKVCVVDILGHICVCKIFNIMEQGLEEILISLACAPAPNPCSLI
jgi:hypothetical protein